MNKLPVIVGFGGINPAGRASFDHAYHRLVIDALSAQKQDRTYKSLASLMGLDDSDANESITRQHILDHTLIRRIELFDPDQVYRQSAIKLNSSNAEPLTFVLAKKHLPDTIPANWHCEAIDDLQVVVRCQEPLSVMLPQHSKSKVSSAGQLPSGFNPGELYASRNHPRGLQMAVYGASDTIRSTGFTVDQLKNMVAPDQMAVYSGSAMGQLDDEAYGGLFQNHLMGRRVTSKNCPLGLPDMPGDFVNAYVFGSVGETAGIIGACATFLYNVKRGMDEIRTGAKRIVIVGNTEAPVIPHVMEAYRTMGALTQDDEIMALDGSTTCDNRRACRPFSSNAGFTIGESSMWLVLMDDALALEHGARVLGSVGDVFVNADGYKKSISGPGVGNYLTVGKAMAAAKAILGEQALRQGTYMQAHGTGTPQNRVTESQIFNDLAKNFGIDSWLVGAIKCYVGHSMAPAGGDQLSPILGAWNDGIIPGITTIDHIADDVHDSNLEFPFSHTEIDPAAMPGAFVNSKGFGGNNATGLFLSPTQTFNMLEKRHGTAAISAYRNRAESVQAAAEDYNDNADNGSILPIYRFGEGVVTSDELELSETEIKIPGFNSSVSLTGKSPYSDMS